MKYQGDFEVCDFEAVFVAVLFVAVLLLDSPVFCGVEVKKSGLLFSLFSSGSVMLVLIDISLIGAGSVGGAIVESFIFDLIYNIRWAGLVQW